MVAAVEGVEFICANTDAQALKHSKVAPRCRSARVTKGLGAGANPEIGRQAALEDRDRIAEVLEGCRHGVHHRRHGRWHRHRRAPVVAQLAKELGILTVAVVTRRSSSKGQARGWSPTRASPSSQHVDSLITIPNEKLLTVLGKKTTLLDAFKAPTTCCWAPCRASPT
jgi:cell division protein FtsZ